MSPRSLTDPLLRDTPVVRSDQPVADALHAMFDAGLPAVPVINRDGKLLGIFGEREFIGALFPGYLKEIKYAGFVPKTLEHTLEKRAACRHEPVGQHTNTEHVDVSPDYSDTQIAEIFLHHRVLLSPSSTPATSKA